MSHLRTVMLGCVPFLLSAGTGLACDNSSLNGVYPFTANGFTVGIYDLAGVLQHLNPPQPLSSVGQYTFDGQGNFTRVDFNVGNGVPVNNASTPVNEFRLSNRPDWYIFNRRGLHWPNLPECKWCNDQPASGRW